MMLLVVGVERALDLQGGSFKAFAPEIPNANVTVTTARREDFVVGSGLELHPLYRGNVIGQTVNRLLCGHIDH